MFPVAVAWLAPVAYHAYRKESDPLSEVFDPSRAAGDEKSTWANVFEVSTPVAGSRNHPVPTDAPSPKAEPPMGRVGIVATTSA